MSDLNIPLITLNIKQLHERIEDLKSSIPEAIPGERGRDGKPGRDGKDGIQGPEGKPGQNGKDADPLEIVNILKDDLSFVSNLKAKLIENALQHDNILIADMLKLDEEFQLKTKGEKGDKGDKGDRGERGVRGYDGRDADNELIAINLKNDTSFQSLIKGDKGDPGKDGRDGIDGKDGLNGKDGKDGLHGINGRDGRDGKDGLPGKAGKDGKAPTKKALLELIDPIIAKSETKIEKNLIKKIDNDFKEKIKPEIEDTEKRLEDNLKERLEKADKDTEEKMKTSVTNFRKEIKGFREDLHKTLRDIRDEYGRSGSIGGLAGFGGGAGATFLNEILSSKDVERTPVDEIETDSLLIWDAEKKKFYVDGIINILERLRVELEVQYDRLIDVVGDYTYVGEAEPGSQTFQSVWRIKRIKQVGADMEIRWANSTSDFDKAWDDRTTYTYLE